MPSYRRPKSAVVIGPMIDPSHKPARFDWRDNRMRYFIRHDKDAEVDGSFSVQQLIAGIDAGRIPRSTLASSDIGDSAASLQRWRSCDWFPLSRIPELQDAAPPAPEPSPKPHRVTLVTIATSLFVTLSCLNSAVTKHNWFFGLLALMMGVGVVGLIVQYARQKRAEVQAA